MKNYNVALNIKGKISVVSVEARDIWAAELKAVTSHGGVVVPTTFRQLFVTLVLF